MHPDLTKDFILVVGGSTVGTAGILTQVHDGKQCIIEFTGHVLTPCEARYTITEIELLALVKAIRKWRNLLMGHHVTVQRDHQALLHYRNIKHWNSRLHRWCLEIQDLDMEIQHIVGVKNIAAKALSRIAPQQSPKVIGISNFSVLPGDLVNITSQEWMNY